MPRIDLNCDLGEGAGHDTELMSLITSANIACGGHAGDAAMMRATVLLALQHGVAIGAHPGYEDREHFGRRELALHATQVRELVETQTRALQTIARACGGRVVHVKPHGALYNLAARDAAVARAVAEGVRACGAELILCGLAGSALTAAGEACGLRVAHEVFADRTYQTDGSLTPRSQAGALIANEAAAVAQARRFVAEGRVRALGGAEVAVRADTLCLHGDGAHAVTFARKIRAEFLRAGIDLKAFAA
ncbi:MAG: 5-oxoprolinase subunit PxpA [Candidatus Didemnitutus sp.]|nr:5-oxoprolinase subunit PxpA [Candidatus Didemnitutus sp.]